MHKILIEDIEREHNKTLFYTFDDYMEEFNSNIYAKLELKSMGEFIEVSGELKGTLKLVCDRCLNEYDYELILKIKEVYAKYSLYDEYAQELELKQGQFITDLNGEKEINIYDLLYQSVILALPNKKVCGINCNGMTFVSDENFQATDSRMEVFKNIKIENKNK